MEIIIQILTGGILIWASWKGYQFYSGKTNWNGEKEIKRKNVVEKYGLIFQIAFFLCFFSGVGLIIISFLQQV